MHRLYLNPYVSILETKEEIIIHSMVNLTFKLEKKKSFEFLCSKEAFEPKELLNFFSENELLKLQEVKLLLSNEEDVPDIESMLSRQRGLFSIISTNFKIFEQSINNINILIIGAGAIGTHILWNLITIGIKNITIVDYDIIDESNLNRQLFYGYDDIGKNKIEVLKNKISIKYPNVNLNTLYTKIETQDDIKNIVVNHNFVFKAFDTPVNGTEWLNAICVERKIPYISGGFLNTTGVVGPIYIPDIMPCYSCGEKYEGTRYNKYSPTFSPIVVNVVSKMIQIFFCIMINRLDDLSQYYIFDLFEGKWKEITYETSTKCNICGRKPSSETLSLRTLSRYLIITVTGAGISTISSLINNFIPNYLFISLLILVLRKRVNDEPCIILGLSSVIVTVNFLTYFFINNMLLLFTNSTYLELMQSSSMILVGMCISITIVSILWYNITLMMNEIERRFINVINSKFRKKI